MRFNRGAIIASWKLYPIPRLDVVKYRRLWQFLIAHTRAPYNVVSCKFDQTTIIFQSPLPWVSKAKVRNWIVGIAGEVLIARIFSLTAPAGLVLDQPSKQWLISITRMIVLSVKCWIYLTPNKSCMDEHLVTANEVRYVYLLSGWTVHNSKWLNGPHSRGDKMAK